MKLITGIVCLIASCASAHAENGKKLHDILGVMLVGTAITDVASTRAVINAGGFEQNPIAGDSFARQLAVKSAGTAAVYFASEKVRSSGHPKIALWMRIATVCAWGYATAHNIRMAR